MTAFIHKYLSIAKINFLNRTAYLADILSKAVFVAIIIFIFTQLWKVIYAGGAPGMQIEGFTLGMVLWYFLMAESIVTAFGRIVQEIGNDIKTGDIANHLNKPYNYVLYKYASEIGSALMQFCLTFVIGAAVVIVFIGGMEIDPASVPFIAISVFLAISLQFVMMALLGVFAFWFEETSALSFIYQKIVFSIGGMLMPLEFFPVWLAKASAILPFSYVAYHPARLFVDFSQEAFLQVSLVQCIWIVVFVAATALLYRIVTKKVSVNGG